MNITNSFLPPDAFSRFKMANAFAAGAPPQTQLGELTALLQTPSCIKGPYF